MNAKRLFFILISCGIVYFICDKHLIPKFKGSYLDYSMTDLNQKPIKFDVYKDKYILVDVYATWCSDCLKSISGLKKIREIVVKEGWELVAISNDDTEKTKEFIARKKISYPCWHLIPNYKTLGIYNIPTYFVLDPTGKVIYSTSSPINWEHDSSLAMLRKLKSDHE